MTTRHRGRGRGRRTAMAGPPQAQRSWLPVVGLLALALLILAAARATGPGSPEGTPAPTGSSGVAAATLAPATPPEPGHEVYGYVPYWEMDDSIADHLAQTDLSTLALFSVTQRQDGTLADENGWRAIEGPIGARLLAEAHARGVR